MNTINSARIRDHLRVAIKPSARAFAVVVALGVGSVQALTTTATTPLFPGLRTAL